MRKGKDLIGLSVVGQSDGTQLGHVRDLIFDHETDQVLALVLSERDLFGMVAAQIVPWREVQSIGTDVILVPSGASRIRLQDDERVRQIAETHREAVLSGTQILTTDGKHLGTLADMVIDETTGRVEGYEVSGGFVSDTLRGKQFLPAPPGLSIGQDAAIAPPGAAEALKPQR
jgi:uncharacterized protein YrrD